MQVTVVRTASRKRRGGSRRGKPGAARGGGLAALYWDCTRQPLYSLVFLFPFVIAYEFGAIVLRPLAWPEQQLVAQHLLGTMLGMLGATAFWVPGLALLLTLLCWHFLTRQPWSVRLWVLPLMLVESLLLTLPLLVIGRTFLQAGAALSEEFRVKVVLALGAGIYEELVFRLGLIALLSVLLVDLLRVPKQLAAAPIVLGSALLFSAAHFEPLGSLPLSTGHFITLTLSGGFLSLVFLVRGLGISTGCHAAYNVMLLILR